MCLLGLDYFSGLPRGHYRATGIIIIMTSFAPLSSYIQLYLHLVHVLPICQQFYFNLTYVTTTYWKMLVINHFINGIFGRFIAVA